jgi:RNA polymerase sigma-70 factor (sigma-E family)
MRPARADFDSFVQARGAGLFRTALLLTGRDRAEAEDLLQLCLERTYRHWSRVARQGSEPEAYARQVLVNAANDRWRRLRRRPERPLAAADTGGHVPDAADQLANRDLVLRALQTLTPQQRAAIVLRYFGDLGDAQIAAALGCSAGTVRTHLSRGLARMRHAMDEAQEAAQR